MMWFEPLAEVGTFLAGCATALSAAKVHYKKNLRVTNLVTGLCRQSATGGGLV